MRKKELTEVEHISSKFEVTKGRKVPREVSGNPRKKIQSTEIIHMSIHLIYMDEDVADEGGVEEA